MNAFKLYALGWSCTGSPALFLWCYLNQKELSLAFAWPQRCRALSNGIEKGPITGICPHLKVLYSHSFSHGVCCDFGIAFAVFVKTPLCTWLLVAIMWKYWSWKGNEWIIKCKIVAWSRMSLPRLLLCASPACLSLLVARLCKLLINN